MTGVNFSSWKHVLSFHEPLHNLYKLPQKSASSAPIWSLSSRNSTLGWRRNPNSSSVWELILGPVLIKSLCWMLTETFNKAQSLIKQLGLSTLQDFSLMAHMKHHWTVILTFDLFFECPLSSGQSRSLISFLKDISSTSGSGRGEIVRLWQTRQVAKSVSYHIQSSALVLCHSVYSDTVCRCSAIQQPLSSVI